MTTIRINRAPVLTLWAAVVAQLRYQIWMSVDIVHPGPRAGREVVGATTRDRACGGEAPSAAMSASKAMTRLMSDSSESDAPALERPGGGQDECTVPLTGWRSTRRAAAGRGGLAGPRDDRDARRQGGGRVAPRPLRLPIDRYQHESSGMRVLLAPMADRLRLVASVLRATRRNSPAPQSAATEYIGRTKVGVRANETSSPAVALR